jgi:hypothetical protein
MASPSNDQIQNDRFTGCLLIFEENFESESYWLDHLQRLGTGSLKWRIAVNSCKNPCPCFLQDERCSLFVCSENNLGKPAMMRRLFLEPPIETEWTIWFDDDSFPYRADWLQSLEVAIAAQPEAVMFGKEATTHIHAGMVEFIEEAPWYRGLPLLPPKQSGAAARIEFILGGFWAIKTEWIYKLDWPDRRIVHFEDDYLLGEAIRQNGGTLGRFHSGVKIDTAPRRAPQDMPSSLEVWEREKHSRKIEQGLAVNDSIGVFSMSRYTAKNWEAIRNCLLSFAAVDNLFLLLWEYPAAARDFVESINRNWTIEHAEKSPSKNPVVNIWRSRQRLLEAHVASKFPYALLAEDDMHLCGNLSDLAPHCARGTLSVLSWQSKRYEDDYGLGWMENGLLMCREVSSAIVADFGEECVMHDDRFLFLLAYLHGFEVKTVAGCKCLRHLQKTEKNGYKSWSYDDKRGLLPYGRFTQYVVPGVVGVPGRPVLNAEGIRVARLARERRRNSEG